MIQLFNGMQSSFSMVYDREMGNMRTLLVSPLPRWFLLVSKLVAGVVVGLLQVYVYLAIAWFWEVGRRLGLFLRPPRPHSHRPDARLGRAPAVVAGQAAGKLRRGDEFRDLPAVFCLLGPVPAVAGAGSSARCSTRSACFNPFTHAVELIRFALYGQVNFQGAFRRHRLHRAVPRRGSILAYDPTRGFVARRGGPGGGGESQ